MECFGIINQRTHSVNMQKVEKKLFYMYIIFIMRTFVVYSSGKNNDKILSNKM